MKTEATDKILEKSTGLLFFPKGINRNIEITLESMNVKPAQEDNNPPAFTDEQKALLTEHQGTGFNENGDIINADGTVLILKEDLNRPAGDNNPPPPNNGDSNPPPPNVNEPVEKGYINASGDLVGEDGEVIFTKEEIESSKLLNENGDLLDPETGEVLISKSDLESNTPQSYITVIQQQEGYQFTTEDGKPKVYEDSIEGIREYYNDIAEHKNREAQQEFLNSRPEIKAFARHILAGGNVESFYTQYTNDFSTIDIDAIGDEEKESLAMTYYTLKGFDKVTAQKYIKTEKASDDFDSFVKNTVHPYLIQHKNQQEKDEIAKINSEREKELKDAQDYWTEVNNTVKAGKLNSIVIPQAEISSFQDYISKPVTQEGYTQSQLDQAKETVSQALELEYLRYKGFDFSKLIKKEVEKQKVISLREKLNKAKQTTRTGGNVNNVVGVTDLTLDRITK